MSSVKGHLVLPEERKQDSLQILFVSGNSVVFVKGNSSREKAAKRITQRLQDTETHTVFLAKHLQAFMDSLPLSLFL